MTTKQRLACNTLPIYLSFLICFYPDQGQRKNHWNLVEYQPISTPLYDHKAETVAHNTLQMYFYLFFDFFYPNHRQRKNRWNLSTPLYDHKAEKLQGSHFLWRKFTNNFTEPLIHTGNSQSQLQTFSTSKNLFSNNNNPSQEKVQKDSWLLKARDRTTS